MPTCLNDTNPFVDNYCIFDLETTGFSPYADKIIEISAVKVINRQIVDERSTLINPKIPIPARATQVNNISNAMVRNAPEINEVLPRFLSFTEGMVLVGHNIHTFDMKFILRDAEELGLSVSNDYIDTLMLAKRIFPTLKGRKLTDLADHYGISSDGAHRALFDCRMNQIIYEKLKNESQNAREKIHQTEQKQQYCPFCRSPLQIKNGRFGQFLGCSNYPRCNYTKNL